VPISASIPKGANPKTYGFFIEDGSFEDDPMKIAAAFKLTPGRTPTSDGSGRNYGHIAGVMYPVYNHPKSGIKTKNWSHDYEFRGEDDGPRRVGVGVIIQGVNDRSKGPLDDDHNYTHVVQAPHVDDPSKVTPEHIFKHVVWPAAQRIAQRHKFLNDRAKGGPAGVAVDAAPATSMHTCAFCGSSAQKLNKEESEKFVSTHSIMANGWCRAAVQAHNLYHPIKGDMEEI
jgi:hypothetical protein